MPPKRSPTKDKPSPDDWQITDEWGIYDPAKAGMQALFARLGRPILSAAPSNARRDRRRALRPERPSDGVGLAIEEARRRAELHASHPNEVIPQSPARAMRMALKTRPAETILELPMVADPVPALEAAPAPTAIPAAPAATRRRTARKTVATPAVAAETAALPLETPARPKARPPARGRKAKAAESAVDAAATPQIAATPVQPPAPSPRRPRGPVPLAAWAHAVDDRPAPPRPVDRRGFWGGVFRIPAEVALVEYAHGCRIQRLLIEAATDAVPDFI